MLEKKRKIINDRKKKSVYKQSTLCFSDLIFTDERNNCYYRKYQKSFE